MIRISEVKTENSDKPQVGILQVAVNAINTFLGKPLAEGQDLFKTAFAETGKTNSRYTVTLLIDVVLKAFTSIGNAFTAAERKDFLETVWYMERGETKPMPDKFAKMLKQPVEGQAKGTSEQERYDAIRSTNENGRSQLAVIRRCHAVTKKGVKYTEANRPLNFQDCLGSEGVDDLRKAVKSALSYSGDCSNAELAEIVNKVCEILPNARNSTIKVAELNLQGTAQQEIGQAVGATHPAAA